MEPFETTIAIFTALIGLAILGGIWWVFVKLITSPLLCAFLALGVLLLGGIIEGMICLFRKLFGRK